jgi:DNA (cytosine-5)-methyltransferase 1
METRLSFIDFCAGIGGGRRGLERAGFWCKNFSEIDTQAIETYQILYDEKHQGLGDLTLIEPQSLPFFDVMIAGFPCQSYSVLGARKGLEDHRGQVIYGLANILKEKTPSYFIFENVKGLLSTHDGQDFHHIINLLKNCSYHVFTQILNTKDFGLPHSRERIYFVGIHHSKYTHTFHFPISFKQHILLSNIFLMQERLEKNSIQYGTFIRYLNNKYNANKFNLDEILSEDYLVLDTRQSDLRLYRHYVPTIRKGRQGILYVKNQELYILSKEEALMLQGFNQEDCFKVRHLNKSQVMGQVGNAMSIPVIEAIAHQLRDYINR